MAAPKTGTEKGQGEPEYLLGPKLGEYSQNDGVCALTQKPLWPLGATPGPAEAEGRCDGHGLQSSSHSSPRVVHADLNCKAVEKETGGVCIT